MRDRDYEAFDKSMRNLYGNDYDSDGRYHDLYYELYGKHGDPTEVEGEVRKRYGEDRDAEEAAKAAAAPPPQPQPQEVETVPEPTETYDDGGNTNNNNNNDK